MNSRFVKNAWPAAAALSLLLGLAPLAHAADVNFRVDLGRSPHWRHVRGTRVEEVYGDTRPDYDVYRYGGSYYVYDNNNWYMSHRQRGNYVQIDADRVPRDFRRVPRDHWRNYPSNWDNDNGYRR
jgi:hypothetical protein